MSRGEPHFLSGERESIHSCGAPMKQRLLPPPLDLPINRKGISSSSSTSSKWFSVFSQGSEGGRLLKGLTGAASPSNLSHFDGAKSSMSPRDAAKKDIEKATQKLNIPT